MVERRCLNSGARALAGHHLGLVSEVVLHLRRHRVAEVYANVWCVRLTDQTSPDSSGDDLSLLGLVGRPEEDASLAGGLRQSFEGDA